MITAPGTGHVEPAGHAPERSQAPKAGELALIGGPIRGNLLIVNRQRGGENINHLQPTDGQELAVAHLKGEFDHLALKGASLIEATRILHTGQRKPVPGPGGQADDEQAERNREQEAAVQQESGNRQDQPQDQPRAGELGVFGFVNIAFAAGAGALAPEFSTGGAPDSIEATGYSVTGTGTVRVISAITWSGVRPRNRTCGLMWTRWVSTGSHRAARRWG